MAKDGLLIKLQESMKKNKMLNPVLDIVYFVCIVYLENTGIGNSLDILYVPLLIIIILDLTKRLRFAETVLLHIGRQSTNMWLIHSFFCYYFYRVVVIVVTPRWAFPSLVLLVLFTYAASLFVTYFWGTGKKVVGIAQRNFYGKSER